MIFFACINNLVFVILVIFLSRLFQPVPVCLRKNRCFFLDFVLWVGIISLLFLLPVMVDG